MKYVFVCRQEKLFELSARVEAPPIARGELVNHEGRVYQIADIEHLAVPDGGVDRMRLETQVYLRELAKAELASRRAHQMAAPSEPEPLRY